MLWKNIYDVRELAFHWIAGAFLDIHWVELTIKQPDLHGHFIIALLLCQGVVFKVFNICGEISSAYEITSCECISTSVHNSTAKETV